MTTILKAEKRGAGKLGALRRSGKIPGVIYGRAQEATSIALDGKLFLKALEEAGESTVIELTGLGTDHDVLIKAIEFDPVSDLPLHVDFYAVEKGQKVSVAIPI